MIDFSKIFNIIFVSVCAAFILFLLVSVIVVAAKGKRKCGAFDVILRILSTLVFIAATVMLFAAILAMLDPAGSVCMVAAQVGDKATAILVFLGEVIELPLPELFVALSTVIGFGLSALLFILSMTALIVDCLVANKKSDKKKKPDKKQKVQKTPEQLKREAELERIKRIGESAVRKTSSVASSEKSEKTEKHAKPEITEKAETAKASESQADNNSEPEKTEEPSFDWRSEPKAEEHTAFVGIKDTQDDFDSFDSFDDDEKTEEQSETQDSFDGLDTDSQQDDFDLDNIAAQAETEQAPLDFEEERIDIEEEEPVAEQEQAEEQVETEEEQPQAYDEEQNDDYAETESEEQDDDMSAWQFEIDNAENAESDDVAGDVQPAEEADNADSELQGAQDEEQPLEQADEADEQYDDDGIEPYRDIYIPKIRTVTRGAAGTPTQRPTPVRKTEKPTVKPAVKPAAQNAKPAAKKPTAKPKRGGGKTQKPAAVSSIPPEKKLPVTRRYVILDRHNAVNMFGEYLKERNQAEKDKLKSSINTIIIE